MEIKLVSTYNSLDRIQNPKYYTPMGNARIEHPEGLNYILIHCPKCKFTPYLPLKKYQNDISYKMIK